MLKMIRPVLWMAGATAFVAGTVLVATAPAASVSTESGSGLFRSYCASCHGVSGKGDGPIAANLRIAPADLTLLAKHNHGKFDAEKVRAAIDGRDAQKLHGGSDMPVWGDAFKRSGEGYSEAKVKERIDALVEHIESLQAQP